MIDFLRCLLATSPVVGALLLVGAANARRNVRVRQAFLPLIAVVYSVIALVLLYRFNDSVSAALGATSEAMPLVPSLRTGTSLYIAENCLVLIGFAIIKLVTKPVFAGVFAGGRNLGRNLVSRIYEYVPEYEMWFIELRFGQLRRFYRVIYWVSFGITILLIALALDFAEWPAFTTVAFPALAAMIVGEFYFAIDGMTRREYDRDVLGERDSARRIANYGPLRKIYREIFPVRVLADGVHLSSAAALDSATLVSQLSRAEDDADRLAGAYFERIARARRPVDVNLVEATVELLRGKSVLINNPFYGDLTPYLSLPAYYNLLQYRKCLIITGRDTLADDLVGWIAEGLEEITGIPNLWNVELLSPHGRDGLDVGILRFADVHNLELLSSNDAFLQEVEYVILAEPSRMMATGQLGLGLVLSRCAQGRTPAYVAFDGNHDGLVDALSHLLKLSITEVVASALPRGASSEVVWKAEGPAMHSAILPTVSRYLGMGTEIGAVALKYDVSKVHWVGSESFPVVDMMWIAGQYYAQINAFADLDLSQDALREAVVPTANPWRLGQEENYFLIVEDEISNVYETIRQFATRATATGFVNLISSDYLLRDYMVDNSDLFGADPKAIPSIVADFARTERNAVLRMILALVTFEVSSAELAREFELIGWAVPHGSLPTAPDSGAWEHPIITMLRRAIAEHTGVTEVTIRRVSRPNADRLYDENGEIEYFTIEPGSELDLEVDNLRAAYFFVEDEREDVNRIGSLLFGHVYQAVLPGQFLTYGGRYYEVQSISTRAYRNGVVLRRAADHIRDRRTYRQLRTFNISDMRSADSVGSRITVGTIEVRRNVATVEATSLGYLELSSRSSMEGARRVLMEGLPERTYVNKSVLEIRLPDVPPQVRRTIALLLNETFVTVFPYAHQYVVALTEDNGGEFGDLLDRLALDELSESIFIVEDSMIDLGLIVAVERYWERLLETITDYLAWNSTPFPVRELPSVESVPDFPVRPEIFERQSRWQRVFGRAKSLIRKRTQRSAAEKHVPPGTREAALGESPVVTQEAPPQEAGLTADITPNPLLVSEFETEPEKDESIAPKSGANPDCREEEPPSDLEQDLRESALDDEQRVEVKDDESK